MHKSRTASSSCTALTELKLSVLMLYTVLYYALLLHYLQLPRVRQAAATCDIICRCSILIQWEERRLLVQGLALWH
jgi:formate-dependent nitrite reductase membrane component NrfD